MRTRPPWVLRLDLQYGRDPFILFVGLAIFRRAVWVQVAHNWFRWGVHRG